MSFRSPRCRARMPHTSCSTRCGVRERQQAGPATAAAASPSPRPPAQPAHPGTATPTPPTPPDPPADHQASPSPDHALARPDTTRSIPKFLVSGQVVALTAALRQCPLYAPVASHAQGSGGPSGGLIGMQHGCAARPACAAGTRFPPAAAAVARTLAVRPVETVIPVDAHPPRSGLTGRGTSVAAGSLTCPHPPRQQARITLSA
jgi:hypothetical protein